VRKLEIVVMTFKEYYNEIGYSYDDNWGNCQDFTHEQYISHLNSVNEVDLWNYPYDELDHIIYNTEIKKVASILDKNNNVRFYELEE